MIVIYNGSRYERKREEQLKENQRKSEERKRKLREYKIRNWEELDKIKELKRKIKRENKRIDSIKSLRCFAQAINSVNKMFKEANQPNNQPDIDEQPVIDIIDEIKHNIIAMECEIIENKNNIKEKEKQYKKQFNREITKIRER